MIPTNVSAAPIHQEAGKLPAIIIVEKAATNIIFVPSKGIIIETSPFFIPIRTSIQQQDMMAAAWTAPHIAFQSLTIGLVNRRGSNRTKEIQRLTKRIRRIPVPFSVACLTKSPAKA